MKRSTSALLAWLLCLCALLGHALPAAAAPPSAKSFYGQALATMQTLPEPPFVDDTLSGRGDGLSINLDVIDHLVWLGMSLGSTPDLWKMQHRTSDYATTIVDGQGERYLSRRSFFDPTWYGTYRALRDGMFGYQDRAKPVAATVKAPPIPQGLKVIAVARVMGPGVYHVVDAGAATCANGDAGHALHLISRDHNPRHQLSDVIIDLRNMRFCSIRFGIGSAFGFQGNIEQHYATVDGFWVQTGGVIDGTLRLFGISAHHGVWHYQLTQTRFPTHIAATTFTAPPTQ